MTDHHALITFAIVALALAIIFPRLRYFILQKRWEKKLKLKKHAKVFNTLYQTTNGFILSKKARRNRDAFEYLYGEIEFIPFIELIAQTKPDEDTVFYDLGSGTGKAVLACSMVFGVKKSCGIELFETLYQASQEQKERLQHIPNYQETASNIEFIHKNFLTANFEDASLIFINATAYVGETWSKLCERLNKTSPKAIIITTTKPLISKTYSVFKKIPVQMSWGEVIAYVHEPSPSNKSIQPFDNIE